MAVAPPAVGLGVTAGGGIGACTAGAVFSDANAACAAPSAPGMACGGRVGGRGGLSPPGGIVGGRVVPAAGVITGASSFPWIPRS